jgi:2-oxoglutarate dehydrogenase complex dehydrogenase (E1) component-like enzyme
MTISLNFLEEKNQFKLNEAVSFENFFAHQICRSKRFHFEGGELLPSLMLEKLQKKEWSNL